MPSKTLHPPHSEPDGQLRPGPPGSYNEDPLERATLTPNPTTLWRPWLYKGSLLSACGQQALDPDLPGAIFQNATFGCL